MTRPLATSRSPRLEAAVAAPPFAVEQRVEPGTQLVGRERLGDVLGGAGAVRVLEGGEVAGGREDEHRDLAQLGVAVDEAEELEGVEGDEVEVEDDGRRRVLLQQPEGAGVAETGRDAVADAERGGEFRQQLGVVVDHRQGLRGQRRHK